MIKENFAVFILTHNRSDRVYTYDTLKRNGYTGPVHLIVDDQDPQLDLYQKRYKSQVEVFSKADIAQHFDIGDNFDNYRSVIYARNASFDIARRLGYEYFIQLDDDYTNFRHMIDQDSEWITGRVDYIRDLDGIFNAFVKYYKNIPALSIAMAQGGDFIGGTESSLKPKRKCMNTHFCSVNRPYYFVGRMNDDVNTPTIHGSRGGLFLTIMTISIYQQPTQQNSGGLTEMYLESGTYVKSFYSILYHPSGIRVSILNTTNPRIHHRINWKNTVPVIINEKYRKGIKNESTSSH